VGDRLATTELSSPIGRIRIAATTSGLVRIDLATGSSTGFHGWLRQHLADAEPVGSLAVLEQGKAELAEYFNGRLREFKVAFDLRGTPFQVSVWNALCEIPFGETRSYADIARRVGRRRAFRAVGLANGANPLPIVVPCHRVINADGKLGGYGGGLETKRRLLAFEQTQARKDLI